MRILVTGGAGYVGSILIEHLLSEGFNVACLDRFFFGKEFLEKLSLGRKLTLIKDDIRWFDPSILDSTDVVLDLAALSNDPVGELDPAKTYEINHMGRVRVARLSKEHRVKHYILASSASVFGQPKDIVDEDSEVNPLTSYSKATRMAEIDILPLNDEKFTVTVLRFPTIYGLSPRMRFDLAVNSMALGIYSSGKIIVTGDGKQWRPFLHVKDVARAYQMVVDASKDKVAGQIFNAGSHDQNYEVNKLAREVGDSIGIKYTIEFRGTPDYRSYILSFKKFKETLGFNPRYDVKAGSIEVYQALKSGEVTDSIKTRTLEWYKYLQSSQKLVEEVSKRDTIL